jgi:hypothetical protein
MSRKNMGRGTHHNSCGADGCIGRDWHVNRRLYVVHCVDGPHGCSQNDRVSGILHWRAKSALCEEKSSQAKYRAGEPLNEGQALLGVLAFAPQRAARTLSAVRGIPLANGFFGGGYHGRELDRDWEIQRPFHAPS